MSPAGVGSNPTFGALLFYPPIQPQFTYFGEIFWSTLRPRKPELHYSARIILAFSAGSYSLPFSTLPDATKTTFEPYFLLDLGSLHIANWKDLLQFLVLALEPLPLYFSFQRHSSVLLRRLHNRFHRKYRNVPPIDTYL